MPLTALSQKEVEKLHKHISALAEVCAEFSPFMCLGCPLTEFCHNVGIGYSIPTAERNWLEKMKEMQE